MPDKSQSILLAGAAVGVAATLVSLVPVVGGCVACLIYIGAGVMAVWHYTDRHQLTIGGGQGAGLGALAALVAMVVSGLLSFLFTTIGLTPPLRQVISEQLSTSGLDPAQADQFMEMASSPLFIVGVILFVAVIYALLGALGGAIGASAFKPGGDLRQEPTIDNPAEGRVE